MNKLMHGEKKFSGFSLVELMVVVSIIAILMALGAVSYTTAQRKARDAARKADMRAVQDGFEQYFAKNAIYDATSTCANIFTDAEVFPAGQPSDPKPSPQPAYSFFCDADNYCACASLESDSGNSTDGATAVNCSFGSGNFFCVTNQQ